MRKIRCYYVVALCAILVLTISLSGCTTNRIDTHRNIDAHGKIEENEGRSISYLCDDRDKEIVVDVFNFDKKKIVKTMKSNVATSDPDPFGPLGMSYYNPVERKTLLLSNNANPAEYRVYLQDQKEIKAMRGLIRGGLAGGGGVFHGDDLYVIGYPSIESLCEIQKYSFANLSRPLRRWKLEGEPQKILMDHKTGNVYALCADLEKNRTILTTVDSRGTCTHKAIAPSYHFNATIVDQQIWMACDCTLAPSVERCKKVNAVFIYDLKTGSITKKVSTKHSPYLIQVDEENVYCVGRDGIIDYLERFHRTTGKPHKTIRLEGGIGMFGLALHHNRPFLFSNRGVWCVEGDTCTRVTEKTLRLWERV